ncbi:hypothetical protein EGT74_07920 [Chitinophaga lutea]|uniref:Uncharacterized protein n=1 Tax=Chitinophaga lutea TaxID=2488634 RepID=A0A3N4Q1G6_9BACT|nr:hypothetical protein EGT74_07920 [Chitinophaga lutea]
MTIFQAHKIVIHIWQFYELGIFSTLKELFLSNLPAINSQLPPENKKGPLVAILFKASNLLLPLLDLNQRPSD